MVQIKLITDADFQRVIHAKVDKYEKLALLADMNRANTLATVKRAGSGHLGSSFSSLDIVSYLYYAEMNSADLEPHDPDRDIYFSSKGHDVPGLYSVLYSLGRIPRDQFIKLRKLGGTYGHPDVSIPGVEANTGSLGMGISKGKGMAFAKRLLGRGGRVFVMTGDGELQEGQIYESLQSTVNQGVNNLTVVIDHNKVQSDKPVSEISSLGDIEAKFAAFGWHVARCDGHDFHQLEAAFDAFKNITDRPKVLVADTLKGRGVSFMEHPLALKEGNGLYRWHSGAPDDSSYDAGYNEILARINERLGKLKLAPLTLEDITEEKKASGVTTEYVADAFGKALVEIAARRPDLVVLDADLSSDCRLRWFEEQFPDRFIENGIAEQDMVSMAGGLALQGLLPVVNSFASFLASRANEQIYTNNTEHSKIIYACHYAGLIPAGPGQSHQSVRDISLFGPLPDFTIIQPCCGEEMRMALEYCVDRTPGGSMLRIIIGPSPRVIVLPSGYKFEPGKGCALTEGKDAALFAYGPVMLNEALLAAELLERQGFGLRVINMPWLNRVDADWLAQTVQGVSKVAVLEDHSPVGGLGAALLPVMQTYGLLEARQFLELGVEGHLACGTPQEVLKYHRLDGASLAERIRTE